MSEWNRSTKQVTRNTLPAQFESALNTHIETFNLGSVLDDDLICIETTSIKKKKGLFGGRNPQQVIQIAIVTPNWLFIGVQDSKSATANVLSIQLQDAVAEDYRKSPAYRMIPDEGVSVTGMFTGVQLTQSTSPLMQFIGLGEEPIGEKFKKTLIEALQKAKQ